MIFSFDGRKAAWLPFAGILLAAGLLLWWAPEESTIGQGIKVVYVHVALTWTGMFGFFLAGLLGLVVLLFESRKAHDWMRTIGWVALALYAAGLGMSALASQVNWGAVFWREPRMVAALNFLAVAFMIQIFNGWVPWPRLRGVLRAVLVVLLMWSTSSANLVLHPRNPIQTSSSSAIQFTFFGLFALCTMAAAWIVWYWRRQDQTARG